MGKVDLETLKERIIGRYDPDYLVDILQLTVEEILDAFPERLVEMAGEFSELEDDD